MVGWLDHLPWFVPLPSVLVTGFVMFWGGWLARSLFEFLNLPPRNDGGTRPGRQPDGKK